MLTEGWDAQTVTHILGVRAFGTQLHVRTGCWPRFTPDDYSADENGHFNPEYAEVYGVPFPLYPAVAELLILNPGRCQPG
jgi:type III restriction enzyme